jgi:hypothetical protein
MRTLLGSQGVWGFVVHGYVEPTNQATKQALTNVKKYHLRENKKDEKAIYLIQNGLDDNIFPEILATRC